MHDKNSLRIQLHMLPESGVEFEGDVPAEHFDIAEADNINVIEDVHFKFFVSRPGGLTALARGTISFKIKFICGRCLESSTSLIENNDICYYFEDIENDCIDLTEGVREDILLSLPSRTICSESCLGLCPYCGKNQNNTTCDCLDSEEEFEVEEENVWDIFDKLDLPEENIQDNK